MCKTRCSRFDHKKTTYRDTDIGNDTVTELEVLYVLANFDDAADGFVSRDERELGDELALMDVSVRAADTAARDLEENVVVPALGDWDLLHLKLEGLAVVERAHGSFGHVGWVVCDDGEREMW